VGGGGGEKGKAREGSKGKGGLRGDMGGETGGGMRSRGWREEGDERGE